MARIYPFRALRYDTSRVHMEDVVTQPYDKITPEMQQRYYERSPYNLIRMILGKHEPGDTEAQEFLPAGEQAHNVYTRAAEWLQQWRAEGILAEEAEPALYGYSQTYHRAAFLARSASGADLSPWGICTTTPTRSSIATSRPFPSTSRTAWPCSKRPGPTANRFICCTPTRHLPRRS